MQTAETRSRLPGGQPHSACCPGASEKRDIPGECGCGRAGRRFLAEAVSSPTPTPAPPHPRFPPGRDPAASDSTRGQLRIRGARLRPARGLRDENEKEKASHSALHIFGVRP